MQSLYERMQRVLMSDKLYQVGYNQNVSQCDVTSVSSSSTETNVSCVVLEDLCDPTCHLYTPRVRKKNILKF